MRALWLLRGVISAAVKDTRFWLVDLWRRLTGGSALGPEKTARYKAMLADLERTSENLLPSKHWQVVNREFERHVRVDGLEKFKSRFFGRRWAAYSSDSPRIFESFIWQYWNTLKKEDDLGVLDRLEEPERGANETCAVHGRRYSTDLLQSIDEYRAITDGLPVEPGKQRIVLELGAGYGRLAWVFLKERPDVTYVIVDLPHSLFVAQEYLSAEFPDLSIGTYEETRTRSGFSRTELATKRLWLLQPWQLSRVGTCSVDVFVNIYSLQEMTHENIHAYLCEAARLTTTRLYLKQHFLESNQHDKIHVKKEDYDVPAEWKLTLDRTSRVYQHVFERRWDIG